MSSKEKSPEPLSADEASGWKESLGSILVAILVALTLRAFVVEAFKIPSGSMIPTLAIGDQIFVNKYKYGLRVPFTANRIVEFDSPSRGEVIVFICPDQPEDDYIKRIVAIAGDELEYIQGVLHINGKALAKKDLGRKSHMEREARSGRWYPFEAVAYQETNGDATYTILEKPNLMKSDRNFGPVRVPEKHVFVMGDNRDSSRESRIFGFVPENHILGRSLFVWWSWGSEGLATDRLGTWID
jgi:signal peptidase I